MYINILFNTVGSLRLMSHTEDLLHISKGHNSATGAAIDIDSVDGIRKSTGPVIQNK